MYAYELFTFRVRSHIYVFILYTLITKQLYTMPNTVLDTQKLYICHLHLSLTRKSAK